MLLLNMLKQLFFRKHVNMTDGFKLLDACKHKQIQCSSGTDLIVVPTFPAKSDQNSNELHISWSFLFLFSKDAPAYNFGWTCPIMP